MHLKTVWDGMGDVSCCGYWHIEIRNAKTWHVQNEELKCTKNQNYNFRIMLMERPQSQSISGFFGYFSTPVLLADFAQKELHLSPALSATCYSLIGIMAQILLVGRDWDRLKSGFPSEKVYPNLVYTGWEQLSWDIYFAPVVKDTIINWYFLKRS